MTFIIQNFILSTLEAICCTIILDSFTRKKNTKEYYEFLVIGAVACAFMFISYIKSNSLIIKVVISIVLLAAIMCIYYRKKFIQIMFLSFFSYGFMAAIDYLTVLMVMFLFSDQYEQIWKDSVKSTLVALLSKMFTLIICIFINKKWRADNSFSVIDDLEWIRFLYFPLMTIISILVLLADDDYLNNNILAVIFGLVIMNVLVFYLIRDIIVHEKKMQNLSLIEERNKNQIRMYKEMEESYKNQKTKVHDFKNQISCILGLLESGNSEKALNYVKALDNESANDNNYVNTNHAIINAIISQKFKLAKKLGIDIVLSVNNLSEVHISDEDLVILLSNLLDNAIEACEKLKDNKIIKFKFVINEDEIIIAISNPVNKRLLIEDNVIATTKNNSKEHGIGMTNINNIINKYNGISNIVCENGYFYFTTIFEKEDAC